MEDGTNFLSETFFDHVLLLEDDPSHLMLITRALRPLVGRITHVDTVTQATTLLAEATPSIIISDLHLPDTPRLDTVKRLKAVAGEVPIVVLTSSSSVRDGVEAIHEGAFDFLVKNFDATFSDVLKLTLSRIREAIRVAESNAKLRAEMTALRSAIENTSDALVVTDATGNVRYSNPAYLRAAREFEADDASIFSLCSGVMHSSDKLRENVQHALGTLEVGGVWGTELQKISDKDASFELMLSAVSERSASHGCFVVWIRDIRERKVRERNQRQLLSTTTHDLKGPLGAISLSCDVLLDSMSEEGRTKQLITRIASSAGSAIHLIEELLSARRIEEGSFI